MTSEDRKKLSEIGYQVIDAKNEHVEKGWIVRVPNDDERVLIAASEGDAWDAARDHHASMTSEVTQALLPCPFCGGEAEMSYYARGTSSDVAGHYVECSECSAGGEPFDIQGEMPDRAEYTKSKAATAWNTRLTAQSGEGRSGAGEDGLGAHLRTLWEAVTAGDLSTAERHNDCELVECPMCHEGSIEAADYCNIDGKALGVQFYGIGPEHGAHERLWTAVIANFPTILAALNARQSGEGEHDDG